ncbi:hypothetical protein EDEG_03864 [Edhazardia aedis USNM 41457]|uniref:Uncharacterized protein n=1 Tax=Edhazardia aedis (strain USNM 41457) TaxID=1003232 RepID=J9D1Y0_EDHAE|nr:hypothetical protein EDEG_03864 [Edhazardia aedis USNM 41457]|eukprot:EJW01579.1 hypothetical protein EDEG_03864 [Edhazardia aedis USNM 41457]
MDANISEKTENSKKLLRSAVKISYSSTSQKLKNSKEENHKYLEKENKKQKVCENIFSNKENVKNIKSANSFSFKTKSSLGKTQVFCIDKTKPTIKENREKTVGKLRENNDNLKIKDKLNRKISKTSLILPVVSEKEFIEQDVPKKFKKELYIDLQKKTKPENVVNFIQYETIDSPNVNIKEIDRGSHLNDTKNSEVSIKSLKKNIPIFLKAFTADSDNFICNAKNTDICEQEKNKNYKNYRNICNVNDLCKQESNSDNVLEKKKSYNVNNLLKQDSNSDNVLEKHKNSDIKKVNNGFNNLNDNANSYRNVYKTKNSYCQIATNKIIEKTNNPYPFEKFNSVNEIYTDESDIVMHSCFKNMSSCVIEEYADDIICLNDCIIGSNIDDNNNDGKKGNQIGNTINTINLDPNMIKKNSNQHYINKIKPEICSDTGNFIDNNYVSIDKMNFNVFQSNQDSNQYNLKNNTSENAFSTTQNDADCATILQTNAVNNSNNQQVPYDNLNDALFCSLTSNKNIPISVHHCENKKFYIKNGNISGIYDYKSKKNYNSADNLTNQQDSDSNGLIIAKYDSHIRKSSDVSEILENNNNSFFNTANINTTIGTSEIVLEDGKISDIKNENIPFKNNFDSSKIYCPDISFIKNTNNHLDKNFTRKDNSDGLLLKKSNSSKFEEIEMSCIPYPIDINHINIESDNSENVEEKLYIKNNLCHDNHINTESDNSMNVEENFNVKNTISYDNHINKESDNSNLVKYYNAINIEKNFYIKNNRSEIKDVEELKSKNSNEKISKKTHTQLEINLKNKSEKIDNPKDIDINYRVKDIENVCQHTSSVDTYKNKDLKTGLEEKKIVLKEYKRTNTVFDEKLQDCIENDNLIQKINNKIIIKNKKLIKTKEPESHTKISQINVIKGVKISNMNNEIENCNLDLENYKVANFGISNSKKLNVEDNENNSISLKTDKLHQKTTNTGSSHFLRKLDRKKTKNINIRTLKKISAFKKKHKKKQLISNDIDKKDNLTVFDNTKIFNKNNLRRLRCVKKQKMYAKELADFNDSIFYNIDLYQKNSEISKIDTLDSVSDNIVMFASENEQIQYLIDIDNTIKVNYGVNDKILLSTLENNDKSDIIDLYLDDKENQTTIIDDFNESILGENSKQDISEDIYIKNNNISESSIQEAEKFNLHTYNTRVINKNNMDDLIFLNESSIQESSISSFDGYNTHEMSKNNTSKNNNISESSIYESGISNVYEYNNKWVSKGVKDDFNKQDIPNTQEMCNKYNINDSKTQEIGKSISNGYYDQEKKILSREPNTQFIDKTIVVNKSNTDDKKNFAFHDLNNIDQNMQFISNKLHIQDIDNKYISNKLDKGKINILPVENNKKNNLNSAKKSEIDDQERIKNSYSNEKRLKYNSNTFNYTKNNFCRFKCVDFDYNKVKRFKWRDRDNIDRQKINKTCDNPKIFEKNTDDTDSIKQEHISSTCTIVKKGINDLNNKDNIHHIHKNSANIKGYNILACNTKSEESKNCNKKDANQINKITQCSINVQKLLNTLIYKSYSNDQYILNTNIIPQSDIYFFGNTDKKSSKILKNSQHSVEFLDNNEVKNISIKSEVVQQSKKCKNVYNEHFAKNNSIIEDFLENFSDDEDISKYVADLICNNETTASNDDVTPNLIFKDFTDSKYDSNNDVLVFEESSEVVSNLSDTLSSNQSVINNINIENAIKNVCSAENADFYDYRTKYHRNSPDTGHFDVVDLPIFEEKNSSNGEIFLKDNVIPEISNLNMFNVDENNNIPHQKDIYNALKNEINTSFLQKPKKNSKISKNAYSEKQNLKTFKNIQEKNEIFAIENTKKITHPIGISFNSINKSIHPIKKIKNIYNISKSQSGNKTLNSINRSIYKEESKNNSISKCNLHDYTEENEKTGCNLAGRTFDDFFDSLLDTFVNDTEKDITENSDVFNKKYSCKKPQESGEQLFDSNSIVSEGKLKLNDVNDNINMDINNDKYNNNSSNDMIIYEKNIDNFKKQVLNKTQTENCNKRSFNNESQKLVSNKSEDKTINLISRKKLDNSCKSIEEDDFFGMNQDIFFINKNKIKNESHTWKRKNMDIT